jgi:Zn-dependent protease
MMLQLLQTDPRQYFAIIIVVIVSIILHELAHGWAAVKLGDRTPIEMGHMDTLNPLVHMGAFSLILLAVVGIAFGAMPVDRTRLRGKYAEAMVAVAGPAMNVVLAILAIVALGLWMRFGGPVDPANNVAQNGALLLTMMGLMNIALAMFNLLPLPPLDGSKIAANFIPAYARLLDSGIAQGAMLAVFFAIFFVGGAIIFGVAGTIHLIALAAVSGRAM